MSEDATAASAPEAPAPPEGSPAAAPTTPATPDVAQLAADLHAAKEQVGTLQQVAERAVTESESAKRYVMQLVSRLQQQAEETGNKPEDFLEEFKERPREVLQAELDRRLAPLMHEQHTSQSQRERDAALRQAAEDGFTDEAKKYWSEVEQFMAGVPADAQAKPGAWTHAFQFVMATHLKDVLGGRNAARVEQEKQSALEAASKSRAPAMPDRLSDVEQRMARAFEMTDAEYLDHKRALAREALQ